MNRSNFYDGQRVFTDALTYSQNSLIGSIQNRVTDIFSYGAVTGLSVGRSTANSGRAFVSGGIAYNPNGERISISSNQDLLGYNQGDINLTAGTYPVVAQYVESSDGVVGVTLDGLTVAEHITDFYRLAIKKVGLDSIASTDVRLANIIVTAPGASFIVDITSSARDTFALRTDLAAAVRQVSIGDDIINSAAGGILFPNSVRKLAQDPNFLWDQTSGRLGVGTASPTVTLDVNGAIRSRSTGFVFPDGTTQSTAVVVGATADPLTITKGITTNALTVSLLRVGAEAVGALQVSGGATVNALTVTNLTSGRIPIITTGGLLTDSAGLLSDTAGNISVGGINASGTVIANTVNAANVNSTGPMFGSSTLNVLKGITVNALTFSPLGGGVTFADGSVQTTAAAGSTDPLTVTKGITVNALTTSGFMKTGAGVVFPDGTTQTTSGALRIGAPVSGGGLFRVLYQDSVDGSVASSAGMMFDGGNLALAGALNAPTGVTTNALTFADGTVQTTAATGGGDPLTITKGITSNALTVSGLARFNQGVQVYGTGSVSINLSNAAGNSSRVQMSRDGSDNGYIDVADSTNAIYFQVYSAGVSFINTTRGFGVATASPTTLFQVGTTNFWAGGRIGIGTNTPAYDLDVVGTGQATVWTAPQVIGSTQVTTPLVQPSTAGVTLTLFTGSGSSTTAGNLVLQGGAGAGTVAGGALIQLTGGGGSYPSGETLNGEIVLQAGSPNGPFSLPGGSISIFAGSAGSPGSRRGGNINLHSGNSTGVSGVGGDIVLNTGTGSGTSHGNILLQRAGVEVGRFNANGLTNITLVQSGNVTTNALTASYVRVSSLVQLTPIAAAPNGITEGGIWYSSSDHSWHGQGLSGDVVFFTT